MPDDSSLLLSGAERVEPLEFTELTFDEAKLRRKMCGRRLDRDGLTVGFCAPPAEVNGAPWVTGEVNGAPFSVQTNWGDLRRLVGLPVEGLSASDAALLIEEKLAPHLERLETQTGLSFRLTGMADRPSQDAVCVGCEGGGFCYRMAVPPQAMRLIQKAFPVQEPSGLNTLPVVLRTEIAGLNIPVSDLRSLAQGDAIVIEPDAELLGLIVQDNHRASARWSDKGLELTSEIMRIKIGEHLGMASETTEPPVAEVDELDVRISVRAGEALMTLKDLKSLGKGSILPLAQPKDDSVDLVVNGQKIGRGQLVTVGGTRAVEILDLFADG